MNFETRWRRNATIVSDSSGVDAVVGYLLILNYNAGMVLSRILKFGQSIEEMIGYEQRPSLNEFDDLVVRYEFLKSSNHCVPRSM